MRYEIRFEKSIPSASYALIVAFVGSESRVNGRLYLSANFLWLSVSSALMPKTVTLFDWKSLYISAIVHASVVQPGVSSFG